MTDERARGDSGIGQIGAASAAPARAVAPPEPGEGPRIEFIDPCVDPETGFHRRLEEVFSLD
jgi:hypothetical protein